MKDIESIIPQAGVLPTIEQLRGLEVEDITVESVRVFEKHFHRTMVYRGCEYEQEFWTKSKIKFVVSDEDATAAEAIVASARSKKKGRC